MELRKTFRFEASHVLPKHVGKCSRLHGHSWVLHVSVEGKINPKTGFVQDFAEISNVVKPLVERLDHHHLGTWDFMLTQPPLERHMVTGLPVDFYPTSENLVWWIAGQLNPGIDILGLYILGKGLEIRPDLRPGMIIEEAFPGQKQVKRISWWSKISIEETCTSMATLTREEYDAETNQGGAPNA